MKKILLFILTISSLEAFTQQSDTPVAGSKIDTSIFTKVDVEASFPGGEQMWTKYIQVSIEKEIDRISRDKKSWGTCEIQFIVDKDGSIINVEALTLKKSVLAQVFIKAIKNSPKWTPASQNNRLVKAYRRQKITILEPK